MLGDLLGKSKYGYRNEEEEKEDPTQTVRRIVSTLKADMEGGGENIWVRKSEVESFPPLIR